MTWNEIRKQHPELPESSDGWHQHSNGGGWVENNCTVPNGSYIDETSVVRDSSVCDAFVIASKVSASTVRGSSVINSNVHASTIQASDVSDCELIGWNLPRSPLAFTNNIWYRLCEVDRERVAIGCEIRTIAEFRSTTNSDSIPEEQRTEYEHLFQLIESTRAND